MREVTLILHGALTDKSPEFLALFPRGLLDLLSSEEVERGPANKSGDLGANAGPNADFPRDLSKSLSPSWLSILLCRMRDQEQVIFKGLWKLNILSLSAWLLSRSFCVEEEVERHCHS